MPLGLEIRSETFHARAVEVWRVGDESADAGDAKMQLGEERALQRAVQLATATPKECAAVVTTWSPYFEMPRGPFGAKWDLPEANAQCPVELPARVLDAIKLLVGMDELRARRFPNRQQKACSLQVLIALPAAASFEFQTCSTPPPRSGVAIASTASEVVVESRS